MADLEEEKCWLLVLAFFMLVTANTYLTWQAIDRLSVESSAPELEAKP